MLSHLSLAGIFDQVAGVIFGQFEKCISGELNEGIDKLQGSVEEVIKDWSSRLCVPCVKSFPYGHGKQSCVLPIGGTVLFNANENTLDIFPATK
jgi:muramoyltetrapeptide carboxypeptidase